MPRAYPSWICIDCGKKYGRWNEMAMATFHHGTCGWCGEEGSITEPRDYGWPRFGLNAKRKKKGEGEP